MTRIKYVWLVFRAVYELAQYDLITAVCGSANIDQRLSSLPITSKPNNHDLVRIICGAVCLAACFYWKPVLCLQRSVCIVRLLRNHGVAARLVIGYRAMPFFSHAWVEVDGRIVNDSPAYQERLKVLYTA